MYAELGLHVSQCRHSPRVPLGNYAMHCPCDVSEIWNCIWYVENDRERDRERVWKGKRERIKCNPLMDASYENNVFSYSIGQTEQTTRTTTGGTFPLASLHNLQRGSLRRAIVPFIMFPLGCFSPRSTASQEWESAMMSLAGCLTACLPAARLR